MDFSHLCADFIWLEKGIELKPMDSKAWTFFCVFFFTLFTMVNNHQPDHHLGVNIFGSLFPSTLNIHFSKKERIIHLNENFHPFFRLDVWMGLLPFFWE